MFIKQIDRNDLLKPLQAVVGIVERKQPLPILSNVLIKKNKEGAKFITTKKVQSSNYRFGNPD